MWVGARKDIEFGRLEALLRIDLKRGVELADIGHDALLAGRFRILSHFALVRVGDGARCCGGGGRLVGNTGIFFYCPTSPTLKSLMMELKTSISEIILAQHMN